MAGRCGAHPHRRRGGKPRRSRRAGGKQSQGEPATHLTEHPQSPAAAPQLRAQGACAPPPTVCRVSSGGARERCGRTVRTAQRARWGAVGRWEGDKGGAGRSHRVLPAAARGRGEVYGWRGQQRRRRRRLCRRRRRPCTQKEGHRVTRWGGTRSCRARQSRALRPRAPRRPQLSVSRLECRGGCGARFEGGLSSRSPAQIDGGATVRVAGGGPRPRGLRILRRASWWGWPIGEGRS